MLEIAAKDPNSDGLLVILTPQAMTDPTQTAQALIPYAKIPHKPVLASWMGGADVESAVQVLNRANIPTFDFPDQAARTFTYMWRYSDNLRLLYETPSTRSGYDPDRQRARDIIAGVRASGRTIMTEHEAKALLETYGIPTVKTVIGATEDDAVTAAEDIGYPVVLKLYSETITHKTDVGGVALNLKGAGEVREAFTRIVESAGRARPDAEILGVTVQRMAVAVNSVELILGMKRDPVFGPAIMCGFGGVAAEVFQDTALGLPPLNERLARHMLESLRVWPLLAGHRGRPPVNIEQLIEILLRFSHMVSHLPELSEVDINPLLATPAGVLALDARMILDRSPRDSKARPFSHLAISPYPEEFVRTIVLKDGAEISEHAYDWSLNEIAGKGEKPRHNG